MMPFTPMNDNIDRMLENLEQGDPEQGSPASEGGVGAVSPDLTPAEQDLKLEGALDEEIAEETKDK